MIKSFIKESSLFLLLTLVVAPSYATAQSACPPLPTATGTVSTSITVPVNGTYAVWSRIQAADTSNNSYLIQIDEQCAITVGDSQALTPNLWTWVNYRDGNSSSALRVSLTQGTHVVRLIGREAGVKLDKVLFTSILSCVPVEFGSNCPLSVTATPTTASTPSSTPPKTANTPSPTTSGSSSNQVVSMTLINAHTNQSIAGFDPIPQNTVLNLATLPTKNLNVRANTSPSKVGSVRFLYDGKVKNTESGSAPYAFAGDDDSDYSAWTPTEGNHTITAIPYSKTDAKGTVGKQFNLSFSVLSQTGTSPTPIPTKDTQSPRVSISIPNHNTGVISRSTVNLTANASDNVGVKKVIFSVAGYGESFTCTDMTAPFSCSWEVPSTQDRTYTITAKSYDAANNPPGVHTIQVFSN